MVITQWTLHFLSHDRRRMVIRVCNSGLSHCGQVQIVLALGPLCTASAGKYSLPIVVDELDQFRSNGANGQAHKNLIWRNIYWRARKERNCEETNVGIVHVYVQAPADES